MEFITLPSQTTLFAFASTTGDDLGEPNPKINSYYIDVAPLVTSKQITFDELWTRLDTAPLLSSNQVGGKSQAARDALRICKMGYSELLAEKVENKVNAVINAMVSKLDSIPENVSFQEHLIAFKDFWLDLCL